MNGPAKALCNLGSTQLYIYDHIEQRAPLDRAARLEEAEIIYLAALALEGAVRRDMLLSRSCIFMGLHVCGSRKESCEFPKP